MRSATALLLLASLPAAAQITKASAPAGGPAPVVGAITPLKLSIGSFLPLEKRFNTQLATLFDANNPLDLLGLTRGVYLEGYGVVFTAELSLMVTPNITPFQMEIPKELADRVRQTKIERLPVLKTAMKEMMAIAARTFFQIPPNQQVAISVRFLYQPWENRTGMPSQILMRADRRGALSGDIQVEEQ